MHFSRARMRSAFSWLPDRLIHRSGSKAVGSGPNAASSWCISHADMLTTVPGGRGSPSKTAPAGGTTRGRWPGMPGLSLSIVISNSIAGGKKREGGLDDQDVPQSLFDDTLQIWKLLQREQVDIGRIWKCFAKLPVESFVHLGRAQHLKDPTPSRRASRLGTGSRNVDSVGKDGKVGQRLPNLGQEVFIFERRRVN